MEEGKRHADSEDDSRSESSYTLTQVSDAEEDHYTDLEKQDLHCSVKERLLQDQDSPSDTSDVESQSVPTSTAEKPSRLVLWIAVNIFATIGIVGQLTSLSYHLLTPSRSSSTRPSSTIQHFATASSHSQPFTSSSHGVPCRYARPKELASSNARPYAYGMSYQSLPPCA